MPLDRIVVLALAPLFAAAAYPLSIGLTGAPTWLLAAIALGGLGVPIGFWLVLRRRDSPVVALAALVLFGGWGLHRFYRGEKAGGAAQFAILAATIAVLANHFHVRGFIFPPTTPPDAWDLVGWLLVIALCASLAQVFTFAIAIASIGPGEFLNTMTNAWDYDPTGATLFTLGGALEVWLVADLMWLVRRVTVTAAPFTSEFRR